MSRWILSIILIYTCTLSSLFASQNKKILLINSYHKGFQWSDDVVSGIEEVLYEKQNVDVNIWYMDSKRISSKKYFQELRDLYKLQLKNEKYDLVLTVDLFAYEFVVQNYKELFTDELIYFVGIEQFSKDFVKRYGLENRVSGLLERRAIEDIVKLTYKTIPSLKKLYILNDKSANGDDTEPFITKAIVEMGNKFEIEYIRKSNLEKLKKKFSNFKRDEALFFVRFYNNENGTLNKNSEIAKMIDSCNIPVFVTDTLFIGTGAFGGKLVLIKELGRDAGKRVVELLENQTKSPIIEVAENFEYIFDYEKAKEFRLNIPVKEYEYVNSPLSFFDRYREFINFVFIISPFFVLLIVVLIYSLYFRIKNARLEKEMAKHQDFIIQQSKLAEIGEVFSSIAHQWKAPLVEIATVAQEKIYEEGADEKDSQFVNDIMIQVKYMTDTINDFQDFIMPSSKKVSFDIRDAIVKMMEIVRHNMKYNYIDVSISVKEDEEFCVRGYKNELMQSLLNIVNNSKEAILKQRSEQKINRGKIDIDIFEEGKKIFIQIQDNGGGIDEENIKNIFAPYFTTKKKGHGIGLYMTKVIIENKMGGKIQVQNASNGAKFVIQLERCRENTSS